MHEMQGMQGGVNDGRRVEKYQKLETQHSDNLD